MPDETSPSPTTFPRRAVTRGAAWSVPVVALAATAPAFATSQTGDLRLTVSEPQVNGNQDTYSIVVTNLGPGSVAAGALTFTVTLDDPTTTWGGWTSDQQYFGNVVVSVENGVLVYTFTSIQELSADEATTFFLVFLNNTRPAHKGPSTALMTAAAPNFTSASTRVQVYRAS